MPWTRVRCIHTHGPLSPGGTKCLPLFGNDTADRKIESLLVLIVGIIVASLLFTMVCAHCLTLTRLMNLIMIILLSSLLQNRKVGKCSASLIGG